MSEIALFNEFFQLRRKKKSLMTFQLPPPLWDYKNIRFPLNSVYILFVCLFLWTSSWKHEWVSFAGLLLEGAEEVLHFCNFCFVHLIFCFWSLWATKLRKYYIIFVYIFILQGNMGKTEKNRKENHATKVTKIPKTKRQKYGINETFGIRMNSSLSEVHKNGK